MTDVPYGGHARESTAPESSPKGWFARMLDAIYEARMRQVEREIRRNLHAIPPDILEKTELTFSRRSNERLPFVR